MNFPTEIGREVIERYVTTYSTASILGYPRNYPENYGIPAVRGFNDGSSDSRSSVSQRSRGSFVLRGAPRGGRGMSRGGMMNIPNWRPQSSGAGNTIREQQHEDDPTPTATNTGRGFSTDHQKLVTKSQTAPTFSLDDLNNAPVADISALQAAEPIQFVMAQDGRFMVVRTTKPPVVQPATTTQRRSVFDDGPAQTTQNRSADLSSLRGGLGSHGRSSQHAANGRRSNDTQLPYAARSHHGHGRSPSAAMLHQTAMSAAHQERPRGQYHPTTIEPSYIYHDQQTTSLGFQNNESQLPRSSARHDYQVRHGNGGGYDEFPTPTHRPPPHVVRQGSNGSDDVPTTYHSVSEWQSESVPGMSHLQLKAYFFTLAAEQHILEYQSMLPSISGQTRECMRARMRRIVELKGEIYNEVCCILRL